MKSSSSLLPLPTHRTTIFTTVRSGTKKKDVDENRLLRTRPTFSKSVMVSVGVSKLGCTAIHFIEPGVKVNGEYYRNNLLGQKLLPDMRRLSQDDFFCFNRGRRPCPPSTRHHHFPGARLRETRPISYLRHCGRRISRSWIWNFLYMRKFTAPK